MLTSSTILDKSWSQRFGTLFIHVTTADPTPILPAFRAVPSRLKSVIYTDFLILSFSSKRWFHCSLLVRDFTRIKQPAMPSAHFCALITRHLWYASLKRNSALHELRAWLSHLCLYDLHETFPDRLRTLWFWTSHPHFMPYTGFLFIGSMLCSELHSNSPTQTTPLASWCRHPSWERTKKEKKADRAIVLLSTGYLLYIRLFHTLRVNCKRNVYYFLRNRYFYSGKKWIID